MSEPHSKVPRLSSQWWLLHRSHMAKKIHNCVHYWLSIIIKIDIMIVVFYNWLLGHKYNR